MSWGPFEHLNIYLHYGLPKLGFKNTIGNRPLLRSENFYHGGMDGWGMDGWNNFSSFFFFILISDNKHDGLIQKKCLIVAYAFRQEVMSILIFKFRKFKSYFPRGNRLKNFLIEMVSPPPRNLMI